MADRIIKGDSGNDVIIQNNDASRKIEVTNSGDVEVTGDVKTTTVKATNLKANDGTASLEVADSTGDIGFSGNTDLKIKLPSAGGVYESDGSNEILTESSGTVSLKNTSIHSSSSLPSGTMCGFTETTTTPTSSQGLDTSYVTLTGSSVDYTPATSSSFVVYIYQFVMSCKDSNPIILYQPHYDGSAITNLGAGFQYTWGDSNSGNGWEIITFTLPSWSGSKNLQIKYKVHSTSNEARIHNGIYGADGLIKIYRRTYSVM